MRNAGEKHSFAMEAFKVRLNCIDFYQATPTKYDPRLRRDVHDRAKEPKVSVVRVFGSTPTGQKVCAHIHGAFPYMYIEYTGSLAPDEGKLRPCFFFYDVCLTILASGRIHPPPAPVHRPRPRC